MPTIIAICPYCRAGGVRAPDTALGASATCPKCKSSFTVMPSDDIPPEWDKPAPKPTPKAPAEPSPLAETRATAVMPDVTEPSPVLPADAKQKKKKAKPAAEAAPAPAPSSDSEGEAAPPTDYGMVFALGALCLVGPAMVATLFPFGRYIGLVLAAAGFAGGLLALGAEGRARRAGILAAALHFFALVVLLFLPSWLDLDSWRGAAVPEAPKGPLAVENATGAPTPATAGDWLDAAKYSWQHGDVRVSVRAAVGPVELYGPNGAKRTTKEQYLYLLLRVRNVAFEKELPLAGWASGQGTDGVRVSDANGKPLSPATFEANWSPGRNATAARAMPGHAAETVLIFAAPPAKTDFVRVQLAGGAVGAPDEIRFRAGAAPLQPGQPSPPALP